MSLNAQYMTNVSLAVYFVDRDTGAPLSGGKVYFWQDDDHTTPKNVYQLVGTGETGTYTYSPLSNPLTLSSVGTPIGPSGNYINIYAYPYDADGNVQLYYVTVFDSNGNYQYSIPAWPNSAIGSGSTSTTAAINYIPNGQFWAHTNLLNNALVGGENIIAQGGFSIVLDNGATSTNTLTYSVEPFTMNPTGSPRYVANFACTNPNSLETDKIFRIKFDDVNKFSSPSEDYTFAFWNQATSDVPVTINVTKNFGTGGSSSVTTVQESYTIQTTSSFTNVTLNFGSNAGYNIGSLNDDYVAIDIVFPTSLAFNASLTDFVLLQGDQVIAYFPVQTSSDMITRGIMGWANNPNPDGSDLYTSPVLTLAGMTWDHGSIGDIRATIGNVPSIYGSTAVSNNMLCDGTSYITNTRSYNGIPLSRLCSYLIANSPIANIPMYGTGANFVTAYTNAGNTSLLRLTYNTAGTGSTAASDGNTGWSIGSIVTYNGSSIGAASLNFNAYSNVANTVLCVGTFATANAAASAATSGFTVTTLNSYTGLLAQQSMYAFKVTCVAASSLAAPSSTGKYFAFSNASTDYYMWFQITNESDPAPASKTGIKVVLDAAYTAQDVANVVREVMNTYQISTIKITGIPSAGQYWLFSSNPASLANYYIWYTVDGSGSDPAISGRTAIKVAVLSADTTAIVQTKTLKAIDAYQFASPNGEGMFLRGLDPNGTWDTDVTQRWASISGLSGAMLGTFEYPQLESHNHILNEANTSGSGSALFTSPQTTTSANPVGQTGGGETRPVNMVVNYYIKY